ncbi:carboxypeptidase [Prauserella cavernicola]|uniref:carboxypeptidase n=1 Tax=Prauserella cavernicola TaxID=2800127 RepID=UPI001E53065B|nr:carboxypeptidase [Prauserella cavernicola]
MRTKATTATAAASVTAVAAAVVLPLLTAAPAAAASRQDLAKDVLADDGITLLDSHVSGNDHPESTAEQNVIDTSEGNPASTSPWSDVGVTDVDLSTNMLEGMVSLGKTYSYRVTTIAGGDHSATSYHYAGTAVDIDQIDGDPVNSGNSKVSELKQACEDLGAVEILGPGDAGHDTHVHCAWES